MTSKLQSLTATYCCVPGCDSDTFKKMDSSITLHKFPQDPRQSVKWIQEINSAYKKPDDNAPQWFPTANSVICSKHFQATDFTNDVLKDKAVPTIFINRTDQPTCAKQAEVSKVEDEVTVKKPTEEIKDILARASDLFNKNMAIAKSLEKDVPESSEVAKENEGTAAPVSPNLPDLNLDMSLADIQSKLNTSKAETEVQKDKEPTDSGTTSTPVAKTQVGGKRKLEEGPQFDFIKIGENKYLKVQRVSGSGNANKNGQTAVKPPDPALVDMLTKNCSATEKQNIINALNKYNMSAPVPASASSTTSAVPKMVSSNSDGKLEIAPQSEFIRIGEGKYLKISRGNANGKTLVPTVVYPTPATEKKSPVTGPKGLKKPFNISPKASAKPKSSTPIKRKNSPIKKTKNKKKSDSDDSSDEDTSDSDDSSDDDDLPDLSAITDASPTKRKKVDDNMIKAIDNTIEAVVTGNESVSGETNTSVTGSETSSNFNTSSTKKNKKYKRSYFKFGTMPMFRLSLEEENGLLKTKIKELEKRSVMPINRQTALERENIILKKEVEKLKKEANQAPKDHLYKKLKAITEESGKGDASAAYILDQINSFQSKIQKFSNSTYLHCALLCRKNAQAYELFRKCDLFKLPAFNTVDRFLRRNPNVNLTAKTNSEDINKNMNPNPNISPTKPNMFPHQQNNKSPRRAPVQVLTNSPRSRGHPSFPRHNEHDMSAVEVDTSNSELREVVLETGEVVQCYASDICVGEDGHQYFIMREDHSNSHHSMGHSHSQDVYVPNAAGQLQYTETEVAIATGMIS